ncbi:MAG: 5-formaminoimidazole-4-carboxamide-1-beta-D-ribofuranosyl 5'-monophosphate synthetase [Paraglaciecola sp.]|jgi:5-formaminoimidazole-4-carboxamide-1-beta-D-ribofuranosyl 5'-monophosphate synthetase
MIQEFKKHKMALSLIAILISIKYVLIPIFDWQDEQHVEVNLLQKQVSRINRVLHNSQEIEDYSVLLKNTLATSETLFLSAIDSSTFELEQQQWLEGKLKQYELDANNIGWTPPQQYVDSKLLGHNVQLNIDGKTSNVIAFIQELQSQNHYIEIQAFNISFKRQSNLKLGTGRTRLNLVFYRREQAV